MEINLGSTDRITRLILGTVLLYAALLLPNGWGVLLVVVATIALVSGATGRCLIYRLLGLSTARRTEVSARPSTPPARSSGAREPREQRMPDDPVGAVGQGQPGSGVRRLTVADGDWTVIDIPLTIAPSGALEIPLLEFLRARAEVAGYYKLTVRH